MNIIYVGDIPIEFRTSLETLFENYPISFLSIQKIKEMEHPPIYPESMEDELLTPLHESQKKPTYPDNVYYFLRPGVNAINSKSYHSLGLATSKRHIIGNSGMYLVVVDKPICLKVDQYQTNTTIDEDGRYIFNDTITEHYFSIYADNWLSYGVVISIAGLTPDNLTKVVQHEWLHIFVNESTDPNYYNDQGHCIEPSCYMHELNDIGDIEMISILCDKCKSYIPFDLSSVI